MRRITLLIGALLGLIAAGGLIYLNVLSRPAAVEILLAAHDIPAGTPLKVTQFRVARWTEIAESDAARYVTAAEFSRHVGRLLLVDLPAGMPLGKAQIDAALPDDAHVRLSSVVTQTDSYYFVLPASPDQIGNWIQPNDHVDLLVSLGRLDIAALRTDLPMPGGYTPPSTLRADEPLSITVDLPATKLVLQNLRVLRVDRAPLRGQTAGNAAGGIGSPSNEEPADPAPADVQRIYVEVTRDQLEILSFVKHNGEHDFAVRAPLNTTRGPSDGIAWDDFARWFFAQRGNTEASNLRPFAPAGPYTPRTSSRP
ncbi:MAG: RcpC/CpaB family pilus assembly protein [Chloroflexi bacterium]|nr:RcpC/CpaB family pilus assembly protein [Chloroflexota bacterium]